MYDRNGTPLSIGDEVVCIKQFDLCMPGDILRVVSNKTTYGYNFFAEFAQDNFHYWAGTKYYVKSSCIEALNSSVIDEPSEDIYDDLV